MPRLAECHPDRPNKAYGDCPACYQRARYAARVGGLRNRNRADFVADYELLRSLGLNRPQIARRLGMTLIAVHRAYLRAVAAGDLTPNRRAA